MNEFKAARDILADVERHSREAKCDWDDPTDVAEYRREARSVAREEVLDLIVPKRICPECGIVRPLSRSWVLNKRKNAALCRSCYQRRFCPEEKYFDRRIFEPITRQRIDGQVLAEVRESLGMTKTEFARRAGWTRQYQTRLEDGDTSSVTSETALVCITVIQEAGGETEDAPESLR